MLDFSSALYLGLRHGSAELGGWTQLTTGAPAALRRPSGAREVARSLAALQGFERGVLAPSSLHLFWDLFAILAEEPVVVFVDAGTYPIARWGVERVRGRGVPVRVFSHHESDALRSLLRGTGKRRPVVVADGFCPGCGGSAPAAEYLELVRSRGGLLVLDDTQALGIMGESHGPRSPYGSGGGGTLRRAGVSGPDVLVGSSLAKGFGAPVAVLCGSAERVRAFEEHSQTRVHCSPPSAAVIQAAARALAVNAQKGDALRLRLARLVGRFRRRLARADLPASGGLFPVQTLGPSSRLDFAALYRSLLRSGVRGVLHQPRSGRGERLSFLITASHTPAAIDFAAEMIVEYAKTETKGGDHAAPTGQREIRGRSCGDGGGGPARPVRQSDVLRRTYPVPLSLHG